MKRLYLKKGDYVNVRTEQDNTGMYLCVYDYAEHPDTPQLKYSVFSGKAATRKTVIFRDAVEELSFYEVLIISEIIENFNQYFNTLHQ